MKYSFFSTKLRQDIVFSRPGTGYVYVDFNECPDSAMQICAGGSLHGSTIAYYGDSQEEFEKVCKKWWRKYLAGLRENGI